MAQLAPPAPRGQSVMTPGGSDRAGSRDRKTRRIAAPSVWRELLLIALFYTAYSVSRIFLVRDGTSLAFLHADQIVSLERVLHLDIELDLNHALLTVPWLARAANVFYATAHFVVTVAVVVWLYRYRAEHYRWMRTALMTATAVALVGFWLFPLAPPRFMTGLGFIDPVTALNSVGLYSSSASGSLANQYAAMPSMHAGWALWCGFALIKFGNRRWLKVVGVLYPVTTVLVILSTANHYVLDAVVGMALVGLALAVSHHFYVRRPRTPQGRVRRPEPQPWRDDLPLPESVEWNRVDWASRWGLVALR